MLPRVGVADPVPDRMPPLRGMGSGRADGRPRDCAPASCFADPFGNQWMLAARIENVTPAELAARQPA